MSEPSQSHLQAWQNSGRYAYTVQLSGTSWAWEYLRHNPRFHIAHQKAEAALQSHAVSERLIKLQIHADECSLAPWRCLITNPPQISSLEASVFWHPEYCPTVLRAVAIPRQASCKQTLFFLGDCPLPSQLLIGADKTQHLLIQDGRRRLQLVVTGASLDEPVQIAAELPIDPRVIRGQTWARRCFEDFLSSGRLLEQHYPAHARSARLRECLQALDGWQAGALPRQVAEVHFGAAVVKAEWNDPSRRLRDWVRNALRRGRALMEGRYQALLWES